jgi:glycosyltransferase involved in cell wall biosynthesis
MEVEQISSLKLDGLVEFDAGSDAELSANYRTALALVYPGLEEGFGMPPLEAMTHGCPVIASSAGGIPEVVGDAAAMFDPTVVESITSAIDAVVSDESLRRTLSARSVDRAELFTWENAATKTVAAYAAALEIARGRT